MVLKAKIRMTVPGVRAMEKGWEEHCGRLEVWTIRGSSKGEQEGGTEREGNEGKKVSQGGGSIDWIKCC